MAVVTKTTYGDPEKNIQTYLHINFKLEIQSIYTFEKHIPLNKFL